MTMVLGSMCFRQVVSDWTLTVSNCEPTDLSRLYCKAIYPGVLEILNMKYCFVPVLQRDAAGHAEHKSISHRLSLISQDY